MDTIAMIVAAGRGRRTGDRIPKQYAMSKKDSMLSLTIRALLKSKKIDGIIVVINEKDTDLYLKSTKQFTESRLLSYCLGGVQRTDSVRNGLNALKTYNPKNVLIHDAARPFLPTCLIDRLVESLKEK